MPHWPYVLWLHGSYHGHTMDHTIIISWSYHGHTMIIPWYVVAESKGRCRHCSADTRPALFQEPGVGVDGRGQRRLLQGLMIPVVFKASLLNR